ncbi:hypothetical protein LLE49_06210 [Alicyclobacillus tolerans]|uniref:hypothetical protein n=1 Tax=Alicyclobacillus tolerans TaxID=90970 RepID=UPI001F2B20D6|nr:hypothetical protein [Alicyclobacillus tolerans]MCF8564337.1 hypothetical protein [Alicyclobacillus tolerans]
MKLIEQLVTLNVDLDRRAIQMIQAHSNLVAIFTALGIGIWIHQTWFALTLAMIGAMSYFGGLSLAGIASLLIVGADFAFTGKYDDALTLVPIKLFADAAIAWLGYHHKQQKEIQKRRQQQTQNRFHSDKVLPWTAANEIRNSLAAIRFLLFPLQGGEQNQEPLQKATDELSRIEKMFEYMEGCDRERRMDG